MHNSALIDEYGNPLVPLDDDKLNGVKPLRIQDQIVTDENGRRRFHGAFTGGFSAGYWNTVGSQEGWKPQNFKSSRNIKATPLGQKPLDFMDEEDLEEFGNAPLSRQDREEDPTIITVDEINLKRVLNLDESKIIAATATEREAKKAEKEKRKAAEYNKRKLYVLQKYGCDTGSASNVWHSVAEEDISAAFEPANIEPETAPLALNDFVQTENVSLKFGFGDYTPLSSEEPSSVPQIQSTAKAASGIDAKKQATLSIKGHAFGVGALEEDDDDIYEKEDMSRYDFSLEDRRKKKQRIIKMLVQDEVAASKEITDEQNIEDAQTQCTDVEKAKAVEMSDVKTTYQVYKDEVGKPNFLKPRLWTERKSRFAPASLEEQPVRKPQGVAKVTEEISHVAELPPSKLRNDSFNKKQQLLDLISLKNSSFVRTGEIINTNDNNLAIEKEVEIQHTKDNNKRIDFPVAISSFKPFSYDEEKQLRYDQFVKANACSEKEIGEFLCTIQPKHMSEWDREMEKKEFIQSRKLYRPLEGIMANRFVTETVPGTVATIETIATAAPKEEATKSVEKIVTIVRTTMSWKPSSQLCKRFNIAEPLTDIGIDKKSRHMKKPQLSVFDYLESSVHTKSSFVTPVIIPKHIPCPKEIIKSALDARIQNVETEPSTTTATSGRPSRWNVQNADTISKSTNLDKNQTVTVIEEEVSADPRRLTFVPKAERRADKEPQPIAEKRELFQTIFSDIDEDEDEAKFQVSSPTAQIATKRKADQLLPTKASLSTTASTNLLRNMSPPRGIFAALFSAIENENKNENVTNYEPLKKIQRQTENEVADKLPDDSYGPAIPKNLVPKPIIEIGAPSKDVTNQKPTEQRISYRGLEIIEKWVEKNDIDSHSDNSSSSSEREQSKHKSAKKSKKGKKNKKKSKKKGKGKHKSTKHKKKLKSFVF